MLPIGIKSYPITPSDTASIASCKSSVIGDNRSVAISFIPRGNADNEAEMRTDVGPTSIGISVRMVLAAGSTATAISTLC